MKHAACEKCARSVGTVNVIGNILMIAVKGYLGVVAGSKGLLADAIHSCADLLATIIMIVGLHISGREQDERFPYGYGKAEYLVATAIYLFLFVIGVYILIDGAEAILEGRMVSPCLSAIWGAVFSIVINELMFKLTVCAGTQVNSPSMVAKAWESRSDVFSSVAVFIGILGSKMGFHFMDPLAAMIVGVIIIRICIVMVKEAALNLMDHTVDSGEGTDPDAVHGAVNQVRDVLGIKELRSRELGQILEFEIGVHVPEDTTVSQGEKIKYDIRKAIQRLDDRKKTVKVWLFPMTADA